MSEYVKDYLPTVGVLIARLEIPEAKKQDFQTAMNNFRANHRAIYKIKLISKEMQDHKSSVVHQTAVEFLEKGNSTDQAVVPASKSYWQRSSTGDGAYTEDLPLQYPRDKERILSGLRDLIAKQNSHTQRYHKQKTQKETTDSLSRDRPKRNSEVDYSIPLLVDGSEDESLPDIDESMHSPSTRKKPSTSNADEDMNVTLESRNLSRADKAPKVPVAKMVSNPKHSLAKRNGPKDGPDPEVRADVSLEPSTDITVLTNTQSKMQKPFEEATIIADVSVNSGDSPPNRAESRKTLPSWSGKTVRKRKFPCEKKGIESTSKKSASDLKDKTKQKSDSGALQTPRNLDVRAPRNLKPSRSLLDVGEDLKTTSTNINAPRALPANVLDGKSNVGNTSIDMPLKNASRSNDAGADEPKMIAGPGKCSIQNLRLHGDETQHELFVSDGDGEELRWPHATTHFQWSPSTVPSSPDILANTIEMGSNPNNTMPEAAADKGPVTLDRITPVSVSPRAQTLPPSLESMLGMHSVRNQITLMQVEADAKQDSGLPKAQDGKKVFAGPLPTIGGNPNGPGKREMSSTMEPEAVPEINHKAPSKRGKHPIDIRFFIIESPPPRISLKRWYCHLHDLSAARMFDAVNEMSDFREVKEVKVSLETVLPRLNNNWRSLRGVESDFNKMREEMRYLIKKAGSEQIKKSVDFRVYIEPIVEEEQDPDTLYGFDAEMLDAM